MQGRKVSHDLTGNAGVPPWELSVPAVASLTGVSAVAYLSSRRNKPQRRHDHVEAPTRERAIHQESGLQTWFNQPHGNKQRQPPRTGSKAGPGGFASIPGIPANQEGFLDGICCGPKAVKHSSHQH